jgi:hypothetical protein
MPAQIAQSVEALAKPTHFSLTLKPEQEGWVIQLIGLRLRADK